ncbi:unnamed protein product [Paramecium pentaurelia]|uniref:Uncharacterized protein n=1 Tax=Paramecium pentaurelia TaxID=43138 RepID=A0A8S1SXN4_9CILI|nr:unnamed protein product [Paramecium pentaurelia]
MGNACSNNKSFQNKKDKISQQSAQQQKTKNGQNENQNIIQEYECTYWHSNQHRWIQKNCKITLSRQKEIIYIIDGSIHRIEKLLDSLQRPEVFTNFEQIQYLQWYGNYDQNLKKVGKWTAYWKGKYLSQVGGYYSEDGSKQGIWKEIMKQFCGKCQVFELGKYQNNQKSGLWIYFYGNKKIGGGFYNEQAQKKGQWIELSENFNDEAQVMYKGEYKNGQKLGIWNILDNNRNMQKYNIQFNNNFCVCVFSGGGLYDEGSDGVKLGLWVEILNGFNNYSQVIYKGRYQNGKKVGRWDVQFQDVQENKQIGGGSYDEGGHEIKWGNWVEILDGFCCNCQVTHNGEYKNGNKIGKWDIWLLDSQENQKIGGGLYDEGGVGIKVDNWVELLDGNRCIAQVTQKGQYKNGKKVGEWDILYENQKIGGGQYDEGCNGIKIGRWIDLDDEFYYNKQVIYKGEYDYGKKIGRWDIEYRNDSNSQFLKIGGGLFDESGNELKIGKWIDLEEGFYYFKLITCIGKYYNGKKLAHGCLWNKNGIK